MLQPYFAKVFDYHGSLIADASRTEKLRRAISTAVKPGDVVLDIGTGSGILAMHACLAGARRVYAIESGRIIEVARALVEKNGLAEKITFIHETSFDAQLPERADVLVTETIGSAGFDEGIAGVVIDARARLLKPGAKIIPRALEVCVAPVEAAETYARIDRWKTPGLDLSHARTYAANNLYLARVPAAALLAEGVSMGRVELEKLETPSGRGSQIVELKRAGTVHGLAAWFRADLDEELSLTNAPDLEATHWGHGFMPFAAPIAVERGDPVELEVEWTSSGAFWTWSLEHRGRVASGAVANGFPAR